MWFILTLWGPGWGHFAGDQRPGPSLAASLTMMPHLALYLHTWCPPPWQQLPRWTHLAISVPGASRVGTAPIPPLQTWQESGLRYPFTNAVLCMWGPFPQILQNPAVCKLPPRAAWEHLQPFCFLLFPVRRNPCPLPLCFCPNLTFCLHLFAWVSTVLNSEPNPTPPDRYGNAFAVYLQWDIWEEKYN